MALLILNVIHC